MRQSNQGTVHPFKAGVPLSGVCSLQNTHVVTSQVLSMVAIEKGFPHCEH